MINVEKTAISTGVSNSTKIIVKENDKNLDILDYGCGKLRNSIYLNESGYKVYVYDTEIQLQNNKDKIRDNIRLMDAEKKYDIILCSFVLNVISEKEIRIKILKDMEKMLKTNGTIYIEVRKEDFTKTVKYSTEYNDGYLIGKNKIKTFQKSYTIEELNEFVLSNTGFKLEKNIKGNHYSIGIYKKTPSN